MTLIDNWRRVMLRAWSVRLMLAAMIIEIANTLPALGDRVPDGLSVLLVLGAAVARVIRQESAR